MAETRGGPPLTVLNESQSIAALRTTVPVPQATKAAPATQATTQTGQVSGQAAGQGGKSNG